MAYDVIRLTIFATCVIYSNTQGADIAFILDGSGSVGRTNYYEVFLDFILEVAQRLPITSPLYQIGLVTFGNTGQVQLQFNQANTEEELRQKFLDPSLYLDENTSTSGGIYVARTQLFSNKNSGARVGVAKVAILMTDGPSTYDTERTPIDVAHLAGQYAHLPQTQNSGRYEEPLPFEFIDKKYIQIEKVEYENVSEA